MTEKREKPVSKRRVTESDLKKMDPEKFINQVDPAQIEEAMAKSLEKRTGVYKELKNR